MKRFHLSKDGVVRVCSAQSEEACRAEGANGGRPEHGEFGSLAEAREWGELVGKQAYGQGLDGAKKRPSLKSADPTTQVNSDPLATFEIPAPEGSHEFSLEGIERAFSYEKIDLYGEPLHRSTREFADAVLAGEVPESLPYELMEFPNDYERSNKGIRVMILRQALQKRGYYAHVTKDFAREVSMLQDVGTVLDPLAGNGFLGKALREQGVPTIITDDHSWGLKGSAENLDALASLEKYGDKVNTVAISWAPYDSDIDKKLWDRARERFSHLNFLVISEGIGGCTGSESFARIHEQFEHVYGYETTYGLRDRAVYYRAGSPIAIPDTNEDERWY